MLSQSIVNSGLAFTVNIDGHDINFKEWVATDDCIYFFPLANLADNGYALIDQHRCTVPFENLYLLDEVDRMVLGVPCAYDRAMRLRGEGMLNTSDFKYSLEFLSHVPDGDILLCERKGNIICTDGCKYLLSESQFELTKRIDQFNDLEEADKTSDFNFRFFADIKDLAIHSNCELDSYLENENVFVPDQIKITVGRDEEGFTIDPSVGIEENEKFQKAFERMRKVQGMYPVQKDNGERVRIVLNQGQKDSLSQLKSLGGRHKTREEIQEITDHPTEYFDPEVFDLSDLYSDRVIEIGVYKPKFYPFICPYKSCWVAGATVETPQNGTSRIYIETEEDLSQLINAIEDAKSQNKGIVHFIDTQIGLDDAAFLVEMGRKQMNSPRIPLKTDSNQTNAARNVLIIKDNAEEVAYTATESSIEKSEKYTLYKDPFLQDDFHLKVHQEEGIAWLQNLYQNKASGCLMADDMGLGKTLQVLYFIDWHSRMNVGHKPYLIVAPISLLENWENEYRRFFKTPRLSISRLTSKDIPRQFSKEAVEKMQNMSIILTNYESLRISQLNFCAVEFDIVALDEAQKIKSPGTMVTNAAKALKSRFKIAMTGTPVENTLLDLWCIMDFCVPGHLGNAKSFAALYQNPLKDEDADIEALGNEVHEKLGIYFLRRMKKDAAKDLPEKIELTEKIQMPLIQKQMYKKVMEDYISGEQPNMLITILGMKEVSDHPYLYTSTLSDHQSEELIASSARLQASISFLDKIKHLNEKVIIFSERRETQKMLQRICHQRYGIAAKIINGDTPSIVSRQTPGRLSRQSSIDEFQTTPGFNVIIMSPVAAGMGLNVTAANHVIHYSRHWNPAKESQATDRAYRIGQTKDVYVYYPMAVSSEFKSFDETLDELLSRKTALATSTIFPTERVEVKQEELYQMLLGR